MSPDIHPEALERRARSAEVAVQDEEKSQSNSAASTGRVLASGGK